MAQGSRALNALPEPKRPLTTIEQDQPPLLGSTATRHTDGTQTQNTHELTEMHGSHTWD